MFKWFARRALKRKMKSWEDHHLDEVAEDFNSLNDKESQMLNGKLTYTGIAVLGLGWLLERFGVPVASGELEAWVAAVVAVIGGAVALYGRYRVTKAG